MSTSGGNRSLLESVSWNSVGQLAPRIGQVVMTPILVSSLGLERYGLWATVWLVVTMLSSLDAGVSSALSWILVRARVDGGATTAGRAVLTAVTVYVALGLVLSSVAFGVGPALIAGLDLSPEVAGEAERLLPMVGVLFVASMLSPISAAIFVAHDRFRLVGLSMCGRVVLSTAGALFVVQRDLGVPALVATTCLAYAAVSTFQLAYALRLRMVRLGSGLLRRGELREFISYGWRMQIVSLTVIVNVQFDAFVLAAMFPLEIVAVYSIAQNVAQSLRYLPMQALQPMFVRMAEAFRTGGEEAATRAYADHQRTWVRYLSLYVVVWMVALPFALERWLGADASSARLLSLVVFGGYAVNLFTGVTTSYVRAIGRPNIESNYALVATGVNLVATVPFALAFGLIGIVGATALGSVVGSVHLLNRSRRCVADEVHPFDGVSAIAVGLVLAAVAVLVPLAAGAAPIGTIGLGVVGATACAVWVFGALIAHHADRAGPAVQRRLRPMF